MGEQKYDYKAVGERIRHRRMELNLTQAELAEKAHLCLPQVSQVELGKVKMNLSTFIRIIEALQISADSILRPDVPVAKAFYNSDFSELLSDCTPAEIDSIIKIVKELKVTMHTKKDNFDF